MSYISLAVYFIAMLGIGVFAYRRHTGDVPDYIPADLQVSPQVFTFSAGASHMCGWTLTGLSGAMSVSAAVIWLVDFFADEPSEATVAKFDDTH